LEIASWQLALHNREFQTEFNAIVMYRFAYNSPGGLKVNNIIQNSI
jgi:hypothetical protein